MNTNPMVAENRDNVLQFDIMEAVRDSKAMPILNKQEHNNPETLRRFPEE